jgi:ComF family protein
MRPSFDSATAVWPYGFPIDTLIRDFKYGHHLYLADFFARHLGAALQRQWQRTPDAVPDLVLPVPLHPNRLKTRGFNQAAEIARHTARRLHLPWSTGRLIRLHDTPAQAGLRREARWSNLRGAFACPSPLPGLKILLIDDVLTTGASLSACAEVLRHAGASRVDVAVLARTPTPDADTIYNTP